MILPPPPPPHYARFCFSAKCAETSKSIQVVKIRASSAKTLQGKLSSEIDGRARLRGAGVQPAAQPRLVVRLELAARLQFVLELCNELTHQVCLGCLGLHYSKLR